MLYNSAIDAGLGSLDIQQIIMDDPTFNKRVARSSENICTLCVNELRSNTNEYQLQCPARSCRYYLCHSCMKCVFSFKYMSFYNCFICGTQYQLQDAEHILNERMTSLDDLTLKFSFKELFEDLPNQFKPEIIQIKKQQQREIESLKGFQRTFTTFIMNPNMTEEQAEEVRQRMPNIEEIFEGQPHESDAIQEVGPVLSSTCAPTRISSNSANVEHENQTATKRIWAFICNICSSVWDNVKRFNKFVGNLIVSLCTSLYRYLRYCPGSLRATLRQQLERLKYHFEHSHEE